MVAYIAAISAHGLRPRAACEISGPPRLDRISRLIFECGVSLHDFSRFGGRFNVPFEFGIAFGLSRLDEERHICFGFASSQRKVDKVLSDVRGVDLHIHRSSRKILFREIANVFVGGLARPTIAEMEAVYQGLFDALPRFEKETGSKSVFSPRIFKELVTSARGLSDTFIKPKQ